MLKSSQKRYDLQLAFISNGKFTSDLIIYVSKERLKRRTVLLCSRFIGQPSLLFIKKQEKRKQKLKKKPQTNDRAL